MTTGHRLLRIVFCLVVLTGSVSLLADPVRADTTIAVSPGRLDITAKPGGAGGTDFTVFNKGSEPFGVAISVQPYPNAPDDFSAVGWIKVDPVGFDLQTGEQRTVHMTLEVPKGLKSSGRYARIAFSTTPPGASSGAGVGVTGTIAVRLFITVDGSGKLSYKASVDQFAPFLEPDGRVDFRTILTDTGNIHFLPTGSVTIATAAGAPYGQLEFPTSDYSIPGSSQLLTTQGTIPLQAGEDYKALLEIEYGGKKPVTQDLTFTMDASVTMAPPTVCENLDRGPTLAVELTSKGEVGVAPTLTMTVRDASQHDLGSVAPSGQLLVWPHATVTLSGVFAQRLASGDYTLHVELHYGIADPIVEDISFSIAGTGPNVAPLCPPAEAPGNG